MRGLERGIERVLGTIRTVAYVEIDAFVIENMVQQMEQGVLAPAPVWSNVKTFVPIARQLYGKLHGITGGYPCQPFSLAGLRKGEADPRHLWPFIKRIIKESRPVWCFFENVEGHLSDGLDIVLKDLRKLGYQVEVGMYSAEEVGAPHRRNRIFILAVENSVSKRMRGWSDVERENWQREIQIARSSSLANSRHCGHGSVTEDRSSLEQTEGPEEFLSGCKLADSNIERCAKEGTVENRVDIESQLANTESERPQRREHECRIEEEQSFTSNDSEVDNVADTDGSGCRQSERRLADGAEQFAIECDCESDRWPAGPGEQQHEWEPPRVESSMGYVLNGYNFREDLLRMAGNAVVEQTAELAFRTLIQKFL